MIIKNVRLNPLELFREGKSVTEMLLGWIENKVYREVDDAKR